MGGANPASGARPRESALAMSCHLLVFLPIVSITILYLVLGLCTLALVGVAAACWLHVRRHMKRPAPSDTLKHVALHDAARNREAEQP